MASKLPPSDALAGWLSQQRWFGGKSHRITAVTVDDSIELGAGTLHVLRVALDDGEVQRYAVPLTAAATPSDALDDPRFVRALLGLIDDEGRADGHAGAVVGRRTQAWAGTVGPAVRKLGGDQSNTSIVVGDALVVKNFRRLAAGMNPDLEITRFLTEAAAFPHTPALVGWLEYVVPNDESSTLAVVQRLVADARDGWAWMLDALHDESRRATTLAALGRLAEATAGLHLALARAPSSAPALAPEPITEVDIARWTAAVSAQIAAARVAAPAAVAGMTAPGAEAIASSLGMLRGRLKCRHHGDFHLGQTLYREAGGMWTIIDFEGEPLRPLVERRQKHAPLRDVAGMLRSIAYAAETVRAAGPAAWIDSWEREARRAFLDGYFTTAGSAPFLPDGQAAAMRVVAAFEVEKAAYEVVYEANNRPDWIAIPLRGLVSAAAALRPPRAAGAA